MKLITPQNGLFQGLRTGAPRIFSLGGKSAEQILADGNTAGWYDFDDSNTVIKNASNQVTAWGDKLTYTEGPEMVDQDNWYKSAYWSQFPATWSQVGNTLHCNGTGLLSKFLFWQIGHTYKVTVSFTFTSGEFCPCNDNSHASRLFAPAGDFTYTYFIPCTNTTMYNYGLNFVGDLTAMSVKEVQANTLVQYDIRNGYMPIWSATGIAFDGINDYLKTSPFPLVQPEIIYFVGKQTTYTSPDWIFDGNVWTAGGIRQFLYTPSIQGCGGAYGSMVNDFAVNTWGILRVLFSGANSFLKVNAIDSFTGNLGTSSMGGFTLGARGDGAAAFSKIEAKEIIIRRVADSSGDEATLYNYLRMKYGL